MSRLTFITGDLHFEIWEEKKAKEFAKTAARLADVIAAREKLERFETSYNYYNIDATLPKGYTATTVSA